MAAKIAFAAIAALSLTLCGIADAKTPRSSSAKAEFKRAHPCPATGRASGPCPGYVIDHREALACGGADSPHNMQWQTTSDAKTKDRYERRGCRRRY